MPDTSGLTSPKLFARYDHDSSFWRTYTATSPKALRKYKGRWPRHGMTRRGRAYELEMSVPPTRGKGSSSLLPTPVVNDMGEGKSVEWWEEWTEKEKAKGRNGNGHGNSLAIEAMKLLPTPTARDWKDGYGPNPNVEVNGLLGRVAWTLGDMPLLPTPTSAQPGGTAEMHLAREERTCAHRSRRPPNGASTSPPSGGGKR